MSCSFIENSKMGIWGMMKSLKYKWHGSLTLYPHNIYQHINEPYNAVRADDEMSSLPIYCGLVNLSISQR
jgi:hypothetical protein